MLGTFVLLDHSAEQEECFIACASTPRIRSMKAAALFIASLAVIATASAETLRLTKSIPLEHVEGRIDHLSVDPAGDRLFVAALGNNTVEVVDLKAGKVVRSLGGFSEPQGIYFVAEFNRVYVANGGDGSLRVLDGTNFTEIASVKFADDADNVRYDATAKQLYVGYGSGALGVVDAAKHSLTGTIPLSAHPESFQLEKTGTRIFVNLPGSHTVAVVDRTTRKVTGTWSLGFVAANYPMALDEANHRAFVACRMPARLLVYDTESGREVAKSALHSDCDDVFYDAKRRQIYASCGEGFIDVFTQADADHYVLLEAVKSESKARTCLFDGDRLYLAAPRRGDKPAAILLYEFLR